MNSSVLHQIGHNWWVELPKQHKMYGWCRRIVVSFLSALVPSLHVLVSGNKILRLGQEEQSSRA